MLTEYRLFSRECIVPQHLLNHQPNLCIVVSFHETAVQHRVHRNEKSMLVGMTGRHSVCANYKAGNRNDFALVAAVCSELHCAAVNVIVAVEICVGESGCLVGIGMDVEQRLQADQKLLDSIAEDFQQTHVVDESRFADVLDSYAEQMKMGSNLNAADTDVAAAVIAGFGMEGTS